MTTLKTATVDKKGFTMVELMVAIVIFALGIVGVAKLQMAAVVSNSFSLQLTEAINIAQDRAEQLRNLGLSANELTVGAHTGGTVTSPQGRNFTVSWNVAAIAGASQSRDVNVTVSWTEKGFSHSTSLDMIKGE